MNNDLISREALNETIEKITWYHINSDGDLVEGAFDDDDALYKAKDIYKAIDNAPTVEEKSYAMGYQDGSEDGLDGIRLQGEWTVGYTAKQKKVAVCNLCNCISFQGKTNFCHNCGADMKGGNNE